MSTLETIRSLWDHAFWADRALLDALEKTSPPQSEAARELAHVLGAEEIWLARLEGRPARAAVWPRLDLSSLPPLLEQTHAAYRNYLATLLESDLERSVLYTNSAGRQFSNTVSEILLHTALHGQYHRGKVNLLLRQSGAAPAPTDYISFVRGVAAATEADAREFRKNTRRPGEASQS